MNIQTTSHMTSQSQLRERLVNTWVIRIKILGISNINKMFKKILTTMTSIIHHKKNVSLMFQSTNLVDHLIDHIISSPSRMIYCSVKAKRNIIIIQTISIMHNIGRVISQVQTSKFLIIKLDSVMNAIK